jgi:hypothetical protein
VGLEDSVDSRDNRRRRGRHEKGGKSTVIQPQFRRDGKRLVATSL